MSKCIGDLRKSLSQFDILITLSNNWCEIVGKDLASECKPLKIEQEVLTIVANHPQWRQALIYNKHKLKESIKQSGLNLKNIRVIQNYQDKEYLNKSADTKLVWENHPSRIKNKEIEICKICKRPTPKGEIIRWGKCTFCWRKDN